MTDMLTRSEAAALVNVPIGLLEDCARRKRGGPSFFKFTTRTILYERAEVLRWHAAARVSGDVAQDNHK